MLISIKIAVKMQFQHNLKADHKKTILHYFCDIDIMHVIFCYACAYADIFVKVEDMTFIALSKEERMRRNAVTDRSKLWPGAVVPYAISNVFNGKQLQQLNSYRYHGIIILC